MKDFGKALARYVIVFNCSDGVDYKMTAKMFAGLAQTGAWACLDEFNRISVEVLSVVATQISEIMAAVKKRAKMFWFEGTRCTYQIRHTYVLSLTLVTVLPLMLVTVQTDYASLLTRPSSNTRPTYAQYETDIFFSKTRNCARKTDDSPPLRPPLNLTARDPGSLWTLVRPRWRRRTPG